jgi:hypothetical protein
VRVTASSVPRAIPAELVVNDDSTRSVLARTVLLSVFPNGAATGARLFASKLTLTTVGGTFKGWAAIRNDVAPAKVGLGRAIDVIPGRLRIAPFLSGPALQPQTVSLDVVIVPGAAPIDDLTVSANALWGEDRRPLPSASLKVSLSPLRHFTAYDMVEAKVALAFVASYSRRPHDRWECTVETAVTLVDRDAATPALWDLRKSEQIGRSQLWLALFNPATGPLRAIFASPADANSFAMWLQQTHATRAGEYQLGMFRPGYSREPQHTRPADNSLIDTFRPVSPEDLDALMVGRLGEP